ncbi:hypothetical protein ACWEKM_19510 [Streptomyces sp. NPDC004752]
MDNDLVQRARWGDLEGQNRAGLVRLSFEVDESPATSGNDATGATDAKSAFRPMTGRDIRSRNEQEKDNRTFVDSRGGRYAYTYEEPDTSAWKRKRVRLPNGEIGYRVIRPVFEGALEDLKRGMAPNGERLDVDWTTEKLKLKLTLEIVKRSEDTTGFVVLPRRWAAERTLSRLVRSRRLVRDVETLPEMHEAMVLWSMTMLMNARLAGRRRDAFLTRPPAPAPSRR